MARRRQREHEREPAAASGDVASRPLERDVDAIEVPTGFRLTLPAGTPVRVMHVLGDTYSVLVDDQYLARVAAVDADALGLEPPAPPSLATDAPLAEQVWAQLRTCYDPEIPVNIVDLGLVYGCHVEPLVDGRGRVRIELTLTAPGCGMGDVLCDDVERKVRALPGVDEVAVEVVLDPPWDAGRLSEAARLQLGLL